MTTETKKRIGDSWNPLLKSYPDSEKINSVSLGAETLFTRLIAKSDDDGNFEGSPAQLLCKLYSHRWENGELEIKDLKQWRGELVTAGLIEVYVVRGKQYVHVSNCKKCLRAGRPKKLVFPENSHCPPSDDQTEAKKQPPVSPEVSEVATLEQEQEQDQEHNEKQDQKQRSVEDNLYIGFVGCMQNIYKCKWSTADKAGIRAIFNRHLRLVGKDNFYHRQQELAAIAQASLKKDLPGVWFMAEQNEKWPDEADSLPGL